MVKSGLDSSKSSPAVPVGVFNARRSVFFTSSARRSVQRQRRIALCAAAWDSIAAVPGAAGEDRPRQGDLVKVAYLRSSETDRHTPGPTSGPASPVKATDLKTLGGQVRPRQVKALP